MSSVRFVALAAALLLSRSAMAQPAADAAAKGSKELQATIDKYVADYNSGAVDKVMAHWAVNADFVDVHGRFHQGRELISALFRRGFADNPGRTLKLTSSARNFLTPEAAVDDGILEFVAADGEKARGRYTTIWTKVGQAWLIRSARDIPIEEEPEASEPQPPPLEELAWLVGKWQAKSEKHQIALDCEWQLDKSFLVQTFQVKSAEDDFRVVTYIAFDPAESRFRSWYFDSRGGFGGGAWTQRGKVYKIAIVSVLPDGGIGSSVMTWEQVDADTAAWQSLEREVNGEPLPDAAQKYVRVK